MLYKAGSLINYKLGARDGELGKVKEFYFDDQYYWAIRYLVADTGNWLKGRQVLISPYALAAVGEIEEVITTSLTKKQIEASPSLDSAKPVSRQFEEEYYGYYGWPMYWSGASMWGSYTLPERAGLKQVKSTKTGKAWDPHLRSTNAVTNNYIQALDGEIGHVEDFIIDDKNWAIRYLIVNTQNWWPGKRVLISPQWIERVSWQESKVFVNLSRESIKQAPECTKESLITRKYEIGLYKHYKRDGYWIEEQCNNEAGDSK